MPGVPEIPVCQQEQHPRVGGRSKIILTIALLGVRVEEPYTGFGEQEVEVDSDGCGPPGPRWVWVGVSGEQRQPEGAFRNQSRMGMSHGGI